MTVALGLIVVGGVALLAGFRNRSVAEVLQGITDPAPTVGAAKSDAKAQPANTIAGAPAKGNKTVKGHSELHPGISVVANEVLKQFPGLSITSTTGGSHVSGSYHYQGRAVDIGGSQADMTAATKWINRYLVAALTEGIHNPGLSVKNHVKVSPSVYSAVWDGHRDHIHLAV